MIIEPSISVIFMLRDISVIKIFMPVSIYIILISQYHHKIKNSKHVSVLKSKPVLSSIKVYLVNKFHVFNILKYSSFHSHLDII